MIRSYTERFTVPGRVPEGQWILLYFQEHRRCPMRPMAPLLLVLAATPVACTNSDPVKPPIPAVTITVAPSHILMPTPTVTRTVYAQVTATVTRTVTAPAADVSSDRDSGGGNVYYENCDAARAAGAAPVYEGEPGYSSHLDRDDDGIGCE
ncbi:excalibur calcium-binding domain-containing protein [Streptomyces sp. NPDC057686]|uniref:excalibur calcium-binding domain-containing protein n=1 Tax=Streptomyces sp. NPDC057686 TaxID=3346212 RepID=UPI0036B54AB4